MRILTKDFLELLFPEEGFIEIRAILQANVQRDFAGGALGAVASIYKVKDDHDLFFGVAARRSCRAGGKLDLAYSVALWVDIDTTDGAARLEASGLPAPSIVVASGSPGHVQAYWLLERSCPLLEPCAIACFESYLRGIAGACGGDRACVDASRMLRVPNSRNFKHQPAPYADIIEWQPGRRYRLEDFPQGEEVRIGEMELGEAEMPTREVQTPWLRRILEQGYEGQHNHDRSAVDFKVACTLLEEGFAAEQVLWLCFYSPAIGLRKREALAYWKRTVINAVRHINS